MALDSNSIVQMHIADDSEVAESNLRRLIDWFKPYSSCLIAFSAGVDSSLIAFAAKKALGDKAYAVTSHSPSFSEIEKEEATIVANEIGIRLFVVVQDDLANDDYVKNGVSRCYFCRKNLADVLRPIALKLSAGVCVDGTHADDLQTPRPGIRALRESGFKAPLAELEFTKRQVRDMARQASLSNWDRPSEACLSSRIAFGQHIDLKTLQRVEAAETIVKEITGARIVRVRTIKTKAVVELDKPSVRTAVLKRIEITRKLLELGYDSVEIDPEGYVSGKMFQLFVKEFS